MEDEVRIGRNRPVQVRRLRPDALTEAKRQRFLDTLAATANVELAASVVGASASAFYQLRRRDSGFAEAWRLTMADCYAALEGQLLAKALKTVAQPVGEAERAPDLRPFDPHLALDVLRRRDAEARRPVSEVRRSGYRHIPIEEVERSLIAKLEALEQRLATSGAWPDATA